MAKTLEITSVPDELHDALVERARAEGVSISELVVREIEKHVVPEMSPDGLLERLRRIPPVDLGSLTAADLVHEGREERTDQILDALRRR